MHVPVDTDGEDVAMIDSESTPPLVEMCNDYAKYDIKVDVPGFTDDEYIAFLQSDDWSRDFPRLCMSRTGCSWSC